MKRKLLAAVFFASLAFIAALFYPIDLHRAQLSPTLLAADGELLRAYPAPDGQIRLPLQVKEVDPLFIKMLLAYEDQRFSLHPGVDPLAIGRAFYQWMENGKIVSGGSTLTMQVARLLQPAPRTFMIKLLEVWRAFRLETQYSKNDILTLYLRLAPYGGNLAGLRAGSYAYFGKEPRHLTPDEAALLVALPQNPNNLRPDRFPANAKYARMKILNLLYKKKVISAAALAAGTEAPLPEKRIALPVLAPHLADRLYQAARRQTPWRSTLSRSLQENLETVLRKKLEQLSPQSTIAAMVVDNRTRNVIAYIGNAEYLSVQRSGQIDMVRAYRSPGSTLKPFAYGMAFQDGLAHPETVIRDTPVRFGTYTPSNFNQGYQGDVTLREALQQSLNIPAVKILSAIGPERWLQKLRSTGATIILPDKTARAELPIILGGLGINLFDLMQLYTGLANEGSIEPLHILQHEKPARRITQLLNKKSARQVTDILIGSALSEGVARSPELSQLAVKTGTSYGYRDAWSIGYTPDYTIGIWVGRADGSPSPGQIGRNTAIPVLLSVVDLLPARSKWKDLPSDMTQQAGIPDSLKRWIGDRSMPAAARIINPLTMVYPVDGSAFYLSEINEYGIKLTAQGGNKPYQWYVNGLPLQASETDSVFWKPQSNGAYKITLQDQAGRVITARLLISR